MHVPRPRRVAHVLAAIALATAALASAGAGTASSQSVCCYSIAGSRTVANIEVTREYRGPTQGDDTRSPGESVTLTTTFRTTGGPDRKITTVTNHAPGLKYVPTSDGRVEIQGYFNNPYFYDLYYVTPVVSEDGSTVSFTLPDDAVAASTGTALIYDLTYTVPWDAPIGSTLDNGVTFEASGLAGVQGWPAMGVAPVTVVSPLQGGSTDALFAVLNGS